MSLPSIGTGLPTATFALTNTKAATTTTVTSSVNPSNLNQSVTFTATVTSTAGTPTGTVQFKDDGTNLGCAADFEWQRRGNVLNVVARGRRSRHYCRLQRR